MKIVYTNSFGTSRRGLESYGVQVGQYEYICCTFEDYKESLGGAELRKLEALGWKKAWADMQMEGSFVVMRRALEDR
jgi:hypothetical protein